MFAASSQNRLHVSVFEIHGDGDIDGRRDTSGDLLGELDWHRLAVSIALRRRD